MFSGRWILRFAGESDDALKRIRPRLRSRQRVVADEGFCGGGADSRRAAAIMAIRSEAGPAHVEVDHESRKIDLRLEFDPGVRRRLVRCGLKGWCR